jgi:hypothetical protein
VTAASWVLSTLLPGLAVIVGALKWFIRQEMKPHHTRLDQLAAQQRKTEALVRLVYSALIRNTKITLEGNKVRR